MLFNVFISDPDDGTVCTLSKFVDDTKLGEVCDIPEGWAAIQTQLDRRLKWAEENLPSSIKEIAKSCSWEK